MTFPATCEPCLIGDHDRCRVSWGNEPLDGIHVIGGQTCDCPHDAPDPAALWEQANGDRDEYRRLLREHGHLVLNECRCGCHTGHAAHLAPCSCLRSVGVDDFRTPNG